MNINLKFLLLGTSLSLIPTLTNAQCVATTDCATLGYTQTSCPDGKGLKCPFGNTYACPLSEADFCEKYEFKYTCTGLGYTGGKGKSCREKYISCICTSGYEWKDDKCEQIKPILGKCSGYARNCKIGDILNNDGTCSTDKKNDKTPIGVVIAINGNCGYAMTIKPIATNISWSSGYVDTKVGIITLADIEVAKSNFDACINTLKLTQQGNELKYPAAWKAYNYAPVSAPSTQGKWCLPSFGMLNSLYNNLGVINKTIYNLGGTRLMSDNEHIWTSSENSELRAWAFCTDEGARYGGLLGTYKIDDNKENVVRPIIEF